MKKILSAALVSVVLLSQAQAGSKELPNCESSSVETALTRIYRWGGSATITKVLNTEAVKSKDPTESRWCMSQVFLSSGRITVTIYELRWTSETDNRFWLQVKG
jgi:hypothetical protein